jgi:REP element-mobilizing transposase RayT
MENHLHLVISADDLAKEITNFKSFTARQCLDYYREQKNDFLLEQLFIRKEESRPDRTHHFWQEGVQPKRISSRDMMIQKIEYIHHNPVKRGYVELPEHWRYSSARNYAGLPGMLEVCKEW